MPNFLLFRVLEVRDNLAVIFAHRFGNAVKSFFAKSEFIAGLQNRSFVQSSSNANITYLLAFYRHLTLIIGLIMLYSCQTTQDSSNNEDGGLQSDTISIIHKRYSLPDEIPDIFEYTLIREEKGDSLLSFRYYKDTVLFRHYNFNIRQGKFELIQDKENPELAIVDTIEFNLLDEDLTVFKYEVRLPPLDGDAGFLFNQKYGLMAYSAYSWGNKTVLTYWNDTDFEKELTGILLADSVRYLRRKDIISPPPPEEFGKIKIEEK